MSKFYSKMGKCTGKRKHIYIDHMRDQLNPTCKIHSLGHSSNKCKVLKYFGTEYAKGRDFKKHRK